MNRSAHPSSVETAAFYEDDVRWRLVKTILASRTFSKSTRLSSFLEYISRRTVEGKTDEINEQQIGIHVFGRSPSYNATDDGIVRTQARLLRLRLEEYFEHESPNSPLLLHIPKGGYVPVFEENNRREIESRALEAPQLPTAILPSTAPPTRPSRLAWGSMGGVALVLLLSGLLIREVTVSKSAETAHALWSNIFAEDRTTVIVPSDDALVLFQELTKTPVSLDDYLSGNYVGKIPSTSGPLPLNAEWFSTHQYTSVADLKLAVILARVPQALQGQTEIRYARDLRMEDFKKKNVILIGGVGANPWVSLFSNQLNFDVTYDWRTSEGYVSNKNPKAGEEKFYRDNSPDGQRQNYGVLAFLPGLDGTGDALIFQGTGMAGTESAADFLFNSRSFAQFARRIGATRGRVPHFEVLLETARIGGNAPLAKVIAYRLISP